MTVFELNRDQLAELKINYLSRGGAVDLSYEEIANIDDYVTDAEIYEEYAGTHFTPEDFASSEDEDYCDVIITGANRRDVAFDLEYIAKQIEAGYTNGSLSDGAVWEIR